MIDELEAVPRAGGRVFAGVSSARARVFLGSGLILFLELVLIRELGAKIVHLSYFTNFVLLGSFLGVGLGFLASRKRRSFATLSPLILVGLLALVTFVPVQIDRRSDQVLYFTGVEPSGPPTWVMLPIIFVSVAACVMGPAQLVGRSFRELPPLGAYRLDLLGSLAGIATFTGLALLGTPPLVWGLVLVALFITLLGTRRIVMFSCVVLIALFVVDLPSDRVTWSPYYRIVHDQIDYTNGEIGLDVHVNGIPHQVARGAEDRLRREPQYEVPYRRLVRGSPGRVLVVGAGTGNDVALALAKDAEHVDAVEIDPEILDLGRRRHPDRPYDDPRVTTHVGDGRAYLERTRERFDLILFALPDSLVLVTGGGAIRLESYLFTREAMATVREHLTERGGFAMYNYYREDWLVDRYAGTVARAFGHEPCVDNVQHVGGQAVISVGVRESDQRCEPTVASASRVAPATDDRPFPYFRGGSIPSLYLFALVGILLVSLVAVRVIAGPFRQMRPYADLFFMGAAFLLLETKSVTTFALLFGTTWVVNAIVFAGVLLAVLLAVETTRRFRTPTLPVLYLGIAAALALAYVVPNASLLGLQVLPRLVVAVALAFAPIFLANLAFAKRFAGTDDAPSAFGINILGAMVGGCVEYLALIIGFRSLLIVAGLLYLVAFALLPRRIARVV
ncbi:MAG: Spermidine synthase-like protein [Thermoleophilia bacterium]|nr:Spermidine synthase-like protein [Thermoleophilia bacterium]